MANFFKYQGVMRSAESKIKEGQVKCPSCGSFKTIPYSSKTKIKMAGIFLIVIGFFMLLFVIGIFIGIPLIVIGIAVLASSFAVKETNEWRCNSCGFIFKKS